MQYTAAIFDMDGLMFDTEQLDLRMWQEAAAAYGYELQKALILESVGRTREDTETLFMQAMGPDFDYHGVRNLRIQRKFELFRKEGVPVKNGLFKLLDTLDSLGMKKAVATSTERSQAERMLILANVFSRFDAVVCGDEIARGKPEPDIFLKAAEKIGTDPEQCIVLEDSFSGIRAAAAAGMDAVMIPDILQPTDEIRRAAHMVCGNLGEAAERLRSLKQSPMKTDMS